MAGLYPLEATAELNEVIYMMDPTKVRDQLLVELQKRTDPFVAPFCRYLSKKIATAYDQFSNIDFQLLQFNIRIRIITYAPQHDLLIYVRNLR